MSDTPKHRESLVQQVERLREEVTRLREEQAGLRPRLPPGAVYSGAMPPASGPTVASKHGAVTSQAGQVTVDMERVVELAGLRLGPDAAANPDEAWAELHRTAMDALRQFSSMPPTEANLTALESSLVQDTQAGAKRAEWPFFLLEPKP